MRKQYSTPIVLAIHGHDEADAQLMRELTPRKARAYTIPGVFCQTSITRARNGQNNPIWRARMLLYALRLAGHGREFGERLLARFEAIVDECWPVTELCPIDAEQIEVFADTEEDRVYVAWKNGRASREEYATALERQVAATRTLLATLRDAVFGERASA